MRGWSLGTVLAFAAGVVATPAAGTVGDERSNRSLRSCDVPTSRTDLQALPAWFEQNRGQASPGVRFLARAKGYRAYFSDSETVFVLPHALEGATDAGRPIPHTPVDSDIVRMRFEGARAVAPVPAGAPLPGRSNYFVGDDPSKWVTEVLHFGGIRSRDLLQGVEVCWQGIPGGGLEYDIVLSPGASPEAVQMTFDGVESLRVDAEGDLLLGTRGGVLRHSKPVAWQQVGGRKKSLSCGFAVLGHGRVGLQLRGFDPSLPLVVDPRVEYSTYLGGAGPESVTRVVTDASGNVYIAGSTQSTDFPMSGAYQSSRASLDGDAFVSKLGPSGATLLYSTYLGGNSLDVANGLAVDASGAVYLAGRTDSTDFPTASPIQGNNLYSDAFLTKIAPSGSSLVYSTYLGGSFIDWANDVAVDGTGAAFIVGYTLSTDFPTQSPFQATFGGTTDAFVCKVNSSGSALLYSTYLGGTSGDSGSRIRVDGAGNSVVVGLTSSTNFPKQSPFQPTMGSGPDIFISKVNSSGSALLFSSYLGGNGAHNPNDLVLDGSGAVFVTGYTTATDLATPSAFQTNYGGGTRDAFVMKIAADGSSKVLFTYLGGTGTDTGLAIALHANGQILVAGTTASSNFPIMSPIQGSLSGTQDAFLARLSASAGSLDYSTYFGGSGSEEIDGIVLDGTTTSVLMAGATDSTDFPTTAPYQGSSAGSTDAFLVRVATTPYPAPSGLGSSLVDLDAIQLDWTDNTSDETGFEIERKIGAGAYGNLTTVVAGTVTHTDSPLARGTRFTYRVRAMNGEGPSGWSNETTTTTPPAIPGAPLSPSGLIAILVSMAHVDLAWTDESGDENFFQVQRREGGGAWQVLGTPGPNATSYSDNGVLPDRSYEYRVRAGNNAGYSDYSEVASLDTPASLDIVISNGLIRDSVKLSRDLLKIQGTLSLNGESPDGSFDPIEDGFEVRFGGRTGVPLLTLAPGAEEWITRRGASVWKSPRGSAVGAKLVVHSAEGTWTLVLKRLTLPSVPANPIVFAVAIGNDAGSQAANWRVLPKKTGVLRLP